MTSAFKLDLRSVWSRCQAPRPPSGSRGAVPCAWWTRTFLNLTSFPHLVMYLQCLVSPTSAVVGSHSDEVKVFGWRARCPSRFAIIRTRTTTADVSWLVRGEPG